MAPKIHGHRPPRPPGPRLPARRFVSRLIADSPPPGGLRIGATEGAAVRAALIILLVPYMAWADPPHAGAVLVVMVAAAAAHLCWWLYLRRGHEVSRVAALGTILADSVAIGLAVLLTGGAHSPAIFLWGPNLAVCAIWLGVLWTLPALALVTAWLVGVTVSGVGESVTLDNAQYATLAGGALLVLVVLGGLIAQRQRVALGALAEAEAKARTDPLTGLANRAAFEERLALEIERVERYRHPLTLALLDLDDFKQVNDRHGHHAGDEALRQVAGELGRAIRRVDLAARLGGEEFVLLLPETDIPEALALVHRLLGAVRLAGEPGTALTVSAGISGYPAHAADAAGLMAAADQALYAAKRAGKDRAMVARTPQVAGSGHSPRD